MEERVVAYGLVCRGGCAIIRSGFRNGRGGIGNASRKGGIGVVGWDGGDRVMGWDGGGGGGLVEGSGVVGVATAMGPATKRLLISFARPLVR